MRQPSGTARKLLGAAVTAVCPLVICYELGKTEKQNFNAR
jgi:hypothetical protein